jgi:Dolichyl-phosphate-mannose-protein mannosyltransferase
MKQKFIIALTAPALIVAVAFALRLGFAWQQQLHIAHRALSTIPFLFEPGNIAYSIVTGHGFGSPLRDPTGPTAWTTPVYPYILAGIFRLFGAYTFQSFVAAVTLNIIFSAATCIPIFTIGRKLGGLGVGAGAAWLWALFPNAIILAFQSISDATLSALLAATILWATLEIADSPGSTRRTWAYGLLWGSALMTNPTLLALLPFLLAWLALPIARHGAVRSAEPARLAPGIAAANAMTIAAIALLCCIPWTIRNYRQMHAFVPLRSVFGLQLWLGNNDRGAAQWPGRLHPIDNSTERARYESQGEIVYMRQKMEEGLDFMRSHPLQTARSVAGRFAATWTAETSTGAMPHPIRDFLRAPGFWPGYVLLWNLGLPIAALGGLIVLLRRRNEYAIAVSVFPLIFPMTYYFTLVQPRYRLPVDPALMVLASYLLWSTRRARFEPQKTYTEL